MIIFFVGLLTGMFVGFIVASGFFYAVIHSLEMRLKSDGIYYENNHWRYDP